MAGGVACSVHQPRGEQFAQRGKGGGEGLHAGRIGRLIRSSAPQGVGAEGEPDAKQRALRPSAADAAAITSGMNKAVAGSSRARMSGQHALERVVSGIEYCRETVGSLAGDHADGDGGHLSPPVRSEGAEHGSRAWRWGMNAEHLWMAAGSRACCGRWDLGSGESRDCLTVRAAAAARPLGLAWNERSLVRPGLAAVQVARAGDRTRSRSSADWNRPVRSRVGSGAPTWMSRPVAATCASRPYRHTSGRWRPRTVRCRRRTGPGRLGSRAWPLPM